MKFTKSALTVLCSMLLFCGCTKDSDAVLKVNDQIITKGEYYADFNRIKNAQFKTAPKEFQKDDSYPVLILKDRYTNDIIVRTLLKQEFDKRNIEASKEEVDAKKRATMEQIGSEEQLRKLLKENNISDEKFTEDMTSEVKIEKLAALLGAKPATDKEAENFYKKNKAQFVMPERVQVSHILIDTNPNNIKKALTESDKEGKLSNSEIDSKVKAEVERKKALINEIREKAVKNPSSFAELAKEYSEDKESAQKGGNLGYISEGQTVPEFHKAAFSQKVGVVGPVIETQYGSHILIVKDKTAKGVQPFAKVKEDLKSYLTLQKKNDTLQNLIKGLKDTAKIEYVDASLNPETLKKQADEALKKQIEQEKKAPKTNNKQTQK